MTAHERLSVIDTIADADSTGPLNGIVIADFSRVLAGPYCTMLLADMGATVIKVESPAGDDARSWTPPARDSESTFYLSVNRNKHSIMLDFANEADLETAKQLAARADIVVENFRTGSLDKFGLDYESIARINSNVIYASITGFGSGAGAGLPGYDLLIQAASGLMSLTGSADTEPYRAGLSVFDVVTGLHASIGILGALHHRTATGEGQLIELNLMSSALSGLVNQSGSYVIGGAVPMRMGNEHPSLYPYEPMPTRDGMLIVTAGNNAQFERLCTRLGIPEAGTDPRFNTPAARNANRPELRALLIEALSTHTAEEWFASLSEAGIACAPIQDVAGGIALAEQLGLDPVVWAGPEGRSLPSVKHPVTYARTPADYRLAPPLLNSSADAVRRWLEKTPPRDE